MFKVIKSQVSQVLSTEEYLFSFQNQSMFDGSIEGLPHYVYTDHTHLANLHYPDYPKERLCSQRWIELERTIYHNATLNFTRNSFASRSIIEDYGTPADRVFCVYAGSNIGTDFTVIKQKYKNKHILFVGYEWKRKGGPELIKAFKQVLQVHPDATLTIVGCSPKVDVPNCHIIGRAPLEQLNQYYERASVFCLPSKLEPFAIVLLEAFAHGLPVITSDFGAEHDYVTDNENGYLIEIGNVRRLSEVLIDLLSNPEKCQILGENGRHLVLTKFNWETVGSEIAKNITASLDNVK